MNKIFSKNEKGFTLVETLIAVLIMVMAVVTPLSIASQAMVYSATARDQIIASNLAQEAIDFIRNERDRSALNTAGPIPNRFVNFLNKFGAYTAPLTYCYTATGCAIDVQTPTYPGGLQPKLSSFTYPATPAHIIDLAGCTASSNCPTLSVHAAQPVQTDNTYTYGYVQSNNSNWRPTSFRRTVKMTVIGDTVTPQEVLISVTVTWMTGSNSNTITMNEYLKSWADGIL